MMLEFRIAFAGLSRFWRDFASLATTYRLKVSHPTGSSNSRVSNGDI
jgi:hypothetical protein